MNNGGNPSACSVYLSTDTLFECPVLKLSPEKEEEIKK
jgi:hypothetical protein